ncbi:MAG: pyridoxal-phosphate dependent enzyme, partial [Candidatus Dormiibacterota bacterium]
MLAEGSLSSNVVHLRCVRCGANYARESVLFGCPSCASSNPSNVEVVYRSPLEPQARATWEARSPGVWRFAEALPVPLAEAVTMGEGGTPLVPLVRLGETIGLPRLLAKHEFQNPTASFKDRLASVAISWARAVGSPGIAVSSSGNAGAAAAAYAARAGLPCLVFTTREFAGTMQRFMAGYGAMVVAASTAADRWTLNRAVAEEWGWFPVSNVAAPPVGSHPAGVEGCKTIAFEIAQDLGWEVPDAVVLPVAYGDALSGLYRGFKELLQAGLIARIPRLFAAETFPSLSGALATDSPSPVATSGGLSRAMSVATPAGTYQSLRAIRESEGGAVPVSDGETARAHADLRRSGLLVEFSSA